MLKSVALFLFAPAAFAYSVHLFPASEFSGTPAEELSEKMNVSGLVIEDFEDNQLAEGLRSTLTQSTNPDPAPNAWDGQTGSTEVNAGLFEFALPGVRFFGVGLGDNDGGSEALSINGGWSINLNSFPNHQANGQGKAYYLVVVAGENDPDVRTISIANGYTMVFDHLVFGRSAVTQPPPGETSGFRVVSLGPTGSRVQRMAERIQQQQRQSQSDATPAATRREGELIVNGGFDQIDQANDDGLRGQFGEAMFAPGSTRLTGWSILNAVVGLRDNPPSPAGGPIIELGPRDEAGAISQRVKTEPGKEYELSFLAAGGRNHQIKAVVAGKEQNVDCPDPGNFKRVKIPFRATSAETEVSIAGVGNEGFGPMIDDVSVLPVKSE